MGWGGGEVLRESSLDFSGSQTGLFPPEAVSDRSGIQISKGWVLDCVCVRGHVCAYYVIIKYPAVFFHVKLASKLKLKT